MRCIRLIFVIALIGGLSYSVMSSAIHKYALHGDLQRVKELLAINPKLVNEQDEDGRTPLYNTTLFCKTEVAEYLLDHGADVNAQEAELGMSPLHAATFLSNFNMAKFLIEHGADVNRQDKNYHRTPLDYSIVSHTLPITEYLLTHGADPNIQDDKGDSALHLCASLSFSDENRAIKEAQLLLDHKANINAANTVGFTPLSYAIWHGKKGALVEFLIQHGADLQARTTIDDQPVHCLACSTTDIATLLLKYQVDLNTKNRIGVTPLMYTVGGNVEMTRFLVEHGADVNAVDSHNKSLFDYIKLQEDEDSKDRGKTFTYLVTEGLPIDYRDVKKKTLLMIAVIDGSLSDITQVLARHIDVNAQDVDGKTALHYAVTKNADTVKLLLAKGAKRNIKDKDGHTPVDLARIAGRNDILKLLTK